MKLLFYISLFLLVSFEILNVYFIMPMPGSQEMNSIGIAYFLYSWRWVFRILFLLGIIAGIRPVFRARWKWLAVLAMLIVGGITWLFNFSMTADKMFLQPVNLVMKGYEGNNVPSDQLVIGIINKDEIKAYPVEYLAYHHQVLDSIGGDPMIITYCSVCRTARVFRPIVNGHYEKFRLVGMDHFNAMFEDESTKSWWRQATGEAVTGELKGQTLPEVEFQQMTIEQWFELYWHAGVVMQPDPSFTSVYDSLARYEKGMSKGDLTRTDTLSWQKKSWVVGIQIGNASKAYDWNRLEAERVINDKVGGIPIVLALADDGQSFVAYERPDEREYSLVRNEFRYKDHADWSSYYSFSGIFENSEPPTLPLKSIKASQEFWHSWLTFHPDTEKY